MDSKKVFTVASLTDDLVVEVLSRAPFKSFCRFKCVCKAWLAFSSDPHYQQKLVKVPTGLLHQPHWISDFQLVSLSGKDEEIDAALTFAPHYKHLELVDCCNGLILCRYTSNYTSLEMGHFIVCNPATRAWRAVRAPESHPHPLDSDGSHCRTFLAFDPSWSAQFYIINIQENANGSPVSLKLEVFSSELSTWFVDDTWSFRPRRLNKPHNFIGGVLHVQTISRGILVVEGMEAISYDMPPNHYTIKLPNDRRDGCFGESAGFLHYASPDDGGRTIAVSSLDSHRPCKWSLKHRLCMRDAFGRDIFSCREGYLYDFRIAAIDLEREVIFLFDMEARKLLSYNINSGKVSVIKDGWLNWFGDYYSYVACYSKLAG
ncbi:hypothetical protein VPH35_011361 [Triticum aestivum]